MKFTPSYSHGLKEKESYSAVAYIPRRACFLSNSLSSENLEAHSPGPKYYASSTIGTEKKRTIGKAPKYIAPHANFQHAFDNTYHGYGQT